MDDGEQQKRVAQLSTVSLDSSYDQADELNERTKPTWYNRCAWSPFIVLAGLILVAVGLVLALDRSDPVNEQVVVDPYDSVPISTTYSSLTSGKGLSAPQKKFMEWLMQARNASELYVTGGSSNMSVAGTLFPQNSQDAPLPFDAVMVIDSVGDFSRRQYVALANGRGFEWVVTSLSYDDIIATSGCLTASESLPFDELPTIMATAKYASSDMDDQNEIRVVVNAVTYTVSKEVEDEFGLKDTVDNQCWTIENEEKEFGLRVCPAVAGEHFLQKDLVDLFAATTTCPQLAPMGTGVTSSVPLPLRKWYASYQA